MKRILYTTAAILAAPLGASAGNLSPTYIEPPIQAPSTPLFSWTGPYAGLSAGTTRTKQTRPTYGERDIYEDWEKTRLPDKNDWWRDMENSNCGGEPDRVWDFYYDGGAYSSACKYIMDAGPAPDGPSNINVVGYDTPIVTDSGSELVGSERYQTGTETAKATHSTYGAFAGYRYQMGSGIVLGGEIAAHRYSDETAFEAKGQLGYAIGRALPYLTAGYDFSEKAALGGIGFDYALADRWVAGIEYTKTTTDLDRISARIAFKF